MKVNKTVAEILFLMAVEKIDRTDLDKAIEKIQDERLKRNIQDLATITLNEAVDASLEIGIGVSADASKLLFSDVSP